MKLTTMTQVTVDGVMQGNGGASDWARSERIRARRLGHGGGRQRHHGVHQRDLPSAPTRFSSAARHTSLLPATGAPERARTAAEDPDSHPITTALNTRRSTSRRPRSPTALGEHDCSHRRSRGGHRRAESRAGGELQVHGSGALIRWLLENDLVDEMTLLIVPVVLGQGTRLFPEGGPDIALELVDSQVDSEDDDARSSGPTGARTTPPERISSCRTLVE